MATSKTTYCGDLRTEITHLQSSTKILTDAPIDNHGKGESFSPTDLVASALTSCMLTIMGIAARTHGFSVDGASAVTTKVMGTEPRRIAEIVVEFTFVQPLDERAKRFVQAAAKECPVAQSLHAQTKQTLIFNWAE